mmetsp:Transcript_3518/g.9298  ORF Transcript_3518/g.9298 Transcript_3518/m.9298 type:complete len:230 (+) Transcript_3518:1919-2608(+)
MAFASSGSIHVKSIDLRINSICRANASSLWFSILEMRSHSSRKASRDATSPGLAPNEPSTQPLVLRSTERISFLRFSRRNRSWFGETSVLRSDGVKLSHSHSRIVTRWLGSFQKQCCNRRKSRVSTFFLPSEAALILSKRVALTRRLSLISMSWSSRREALMSLINPHASSSIKTESLANDNDLIIPSRSPTNGASRFPSLSISLDIDNNCNTPSSVTVTTSFRIRNLS